MHTRRMLLSRLWILASVAYGGFRALLVWKFLSGYGVNPWVFGTVELTSSAAYGWASARLVTHVVDRDWKALRWSAPATLAAYGSPDAYVFLSVGHLPDGLWASIVTIACVSAAVAVVALVREVRRGRSKAQAGQ